MSYRINLTGKRVGRLTVVSRASNIGRRARWNCKCDCGKEKVIWACNLLTKASKSCGCTWSKSGKTNPTWKGYGNLSGKQFGEIKTGAKGRNIPFNITIQYLWKLFLDQDGRCALSGLQIVLNHEKNRKLVGTASVDRINNDLGYTKNNVQWVHKDVNFMKQDLTQEQFVDYCRLISNNYEPKNKNRK